MELEETHVKDYFRTGKEVTKWWEPEEKTTLFRALYREQRDILRKTIDPADKVLLDAGTGKGRFALDFAKRGAKKVYAIDISQDMMEIASKRAQEAGLQERITFERMDIEDLRFPDGFFDCVYCMETFVHLPSPQLAMNGFSKVVKPGGLVVGSVTLPTKNWYLNLGLVSSPSLFFEWAFTPVYCSRVYQGAIRGLLRRPPLVGRPLSKDYFCSLFTKAGLTIEQSITLGHPRSPRFVIVAARKGL